MKYVYASAKNTAMSTSTPETRELLRLYKCVVDTGTDVLTAFAKYKLLPTYNGNFKHFLDDKKHELFHLWQSRKLLSCECPPAGCNPIQTGHMPYWIFKKMYDDNGPEERGHIIRNSRNIVQVCLHKYVTRNIAIHELDISTISFLLRNLAILSRNETTSLDLITTTRSQICHAYSTNCYPMAILNTTWNELENALVDLVDPSFKRIIRKDIKQFRKADLEKEEITELMKNVEEVKTVLEAVESSCNNNINHFRGMESRLENISINNTEDIKHHTTEQTNFVATQAQHALSEKIQNTEEKLEHCIRHEAERMNESQASSFQQLGSTLQETRTQIKEVKENQVKTQEEILKAIRNLTLSVKYEKPANLLVPEETFAESMECPVLWQIATPEHWNLEAVIATLRNPSNRDEQFKKKFVRKGSLIMLTTIAASVLSDPGAFETAVISFLTKMIEDCHINTEIPGRVDVRLHILNANEVSISCELPHVDLPQPNSGDKKHLLHTEKFDVAFLNGDDEKEIEWVQSMSTKLKTKYDIQCSILAKDYLNGFPLQRRLGLYLSKFQAVIVTLTKENYKQYEFYITNDMPVIAVELDYLKEVSSSLRKHPFINCTTCEHLWFPRLIDNLRNKLPDHSGIALEKEKDEIVKDCKRCITLVSDSVYHQIQVQKGLDEMRFTLCGSIMDEAWILNFLHQLTNFTEPYIISSWKKSFAEPFTFTISNLFFLISPNCLKCYELQAYALSNLRQKRLVYSNLMIETAVVPSSCREFSDVIDVSSMNQKEIAKEIVSRANKKRIVPQVFSVPKETGIVPQDFSVPKGLYNFSDNPKFGKRREDSSESYSYEQVPYVPAFVSRLQRRTVESSPSGDSSSPSTDVLGSRYYTKYLGLRRRKKELSLPDTDVHGLMDNSELSKIKEDSIASSPDSPGLYNFDFEDNSEFSKRREDSSASYSYKQDLPSKQKIKETQKNPWSKGDESLEKTAKLQTFFGDESLEKTAKLKEFIGDKSTTNEDELQEFIDKTLPVEKW